MSSKPRVKHHITAEVVHPMRYGFIYPLANGFVQAFFYLNLVELFKAVGTRLARHESDIQRNARISIDVFVVLKWAFVIWVWSGSINSPLITSAVAYLLIMNVFTYFYHHVWKPPYDASDENLRSRLVTLLLSIAYSITCFSYLYAVPFADAFRVDSGIGRTAASLLFSISRSFLTDFAPMTASSTTGHVLVVIQTAITFIFISIILSASIPQYRKTTKK